MKTLLHYIIRKDKQPKESILYTYVNIFRIFINYVTQTILKRVYFMMNDVFSRHKDPYVIIHKTILLI